MTQEQLTALQAADADLKQTIADVATRVLGRITALEALVAASGAVADPAVDAVVADMRADITALQALAPPPA